MPFRVTDDAMDRLGAATADERREFFDSLSDDEVGQIESALPAWNSRQAERRGAEEGLGASLPTAAAFSPAPAPEPMQPRSIQLPEMNVSPGAAPVQPGQMQPVQPAKRGFDVTPIAQALGNFRQRGEEAARSGPLGLTPIKMLDITGDTLVRPAVEHVQQTYGRPLAEKFIAHQRAQPMIPAQVQALERTGNLAGMGPDDIRSMNELQTRELLRLVAGPDFADQMDERQKLQAVNALEKVYGVTGAAYQQSLAHGLAEAPLQVIGMETVGAAVKGAAMSVKVEGAGKQILQRILAGALGAGTENAVVEAGLSLGDERTVSQAAREGFVGGAVIGGGIHTAAEWAKLSGENFAELGRDVAGLARELKPKVIAVTGDAMKALGDFIRSPEMAPAPQPVAAGGAPAEVVSFPKAAPPPPRLEDLRPSYATGMMVDGKPVIRVVELNANGKHVTVDVPVGSAQEATALGAQLARDGVGTSVDATTLYSSGEEAAGILRAFVNRAVQQEVKAPSEYSGDGLQGLPPAQGGGTQKVGRGLAVRPKPLEGEVMPPEAGDTQVSPRRAADVTVTGQLVRKPAALRQGASDTAVRDAEGLLQSEHRGPPVPSIQRGRKAKKVPGQKELDAYQKQQGTAPSPSEGLPGGRIRPWERREPAARDLGPYTPESRQLPEQGTREPAPSAEGRGRQNPIPQRPGGFVGSAKRTPVTHLPESLQNERLGERRARQSRAQEQVRALGWESREFMHPGRVGEKNPGYPTWTLEKGGKRVTFFTNDAEELLQQVRAFESTGKAPQKPKGMKVGKRTDDFPPSPDVPSQAIPGPAGYLPARARPHPGTPPQTGPRQLGEGAVPLPDHRQRESVRGMVQRPWESAGSGRAPAGTPNRNPPLPPAEAVGARPPPFNRPKGEVKGKGEFQPLGHAPRRGLQVWIPDKGGQLRPARLVSETVGGKVVVQVGGSRLEVPREQVKQFVEHPKGYDAKVHEVDTGDILEVLDNPSRVVVEPDGHVRVEPTAAPRPPPPPPQPTPVTRETPQGTPVYVNRRVNNRLEDGRTLPLNGRVVGPDPKNPGNVLVRMDDAPGPTSPPVSVPRGDVFAIQSPRVDPSVLEVPTPPIVPPALTTGAERQAVTGIARVVRFAQAKAGERWAAVVRAFLGNHQLHTDAINSRVRDGMAANTVSKGDEIIRAIRAKLPAAERALFSNTDNSMREFMLGRINLDTFRQRHPEAGKRLGHLLSDIRDEIARNSAELERLGYLPEGINRARDAGAMERYLANVYRTFFLKPGEWFDMLKNMPGNVFDEAAEFIVKRNIEAGNPRINVEQVKAELTEILRSDDVLGNLNRNHSVVKAAGNLMERQELPAPIRKLLGPETSGTLSIAMTLAAQRRLLAQAKFWHGVVDARTPDGRPAFFSPGPDEAAGLTERIPENPRKFGPAAGGYTRPEFKAIYDDAAVNKAAESLLHGLGRFVKRNMVLYNPKSWVGNSMRNVTPWMLAGGFSLAHPKRAFDALYNSIRIRAEWAKSPVPDGDKALLHRARELGILPAGFARSEVSGREQDRIALELRRALDANPPTGIGGLMRTMGDVFDRFNDKLAREYDGIDQFWKFATYLNLREKYVAEGMKNGLAQDAAEAMADDRAARRIHRYFPNFEHVGRLADKVRNSDIGAAAPFFTSTFEDIRTRAMWMQDLARRDPETMASTLQYMAVLGAMGGSALALSRANGITAEEEDEARTIRSQRDQTHRWAMMALPGRDEQGRVQFIDLGYIEPVLQMFNGHPADNGFVNLSVNLMLAPWAGTTAEDWAREKLAAAGAIQQPAGNWGVRPGEEGAMTALNQLARVGAIPGVVNHVNRMVNDYQMNKRLEEGGATRPTREVPTMGQSVATALFPVGGAVAAGDKSPTRLKSVLEANGQMLDGRRATDAHVKAEAFGEISREERQRRIQGAVEHVKSGADRLQEINRAHERKENE